MTDQIRILIVDDHAVVREGLRALLDSEPGMTVLDSAVNGREAVDKALALEPDVILIDLVMPEMGGVEAIGIIKENNPHSRILVLTSFDEDEQVFAAVKAGALGYLLKDSSPDELLRAIRMVSQGQASLQPSIASKVMRELHKTSNLPPTEEPLTQREVEVLRLVAKGMSNQQIAENLVISERTVSTHVSTILDKLHLANRTQAALYALREGLASLDEE